MANYTSIHTGAVIDDSITREVARRTLYAGGDASATQALDITDGEHQEWELVANTNFTTTAAASGKAETMYLHLTQDAGGDNTVSVNGVDITDYVSLLPFSRSLVKLIITANDVFVYPEDTQSDLAIYLDFINKNYAIDGKYKSAALALNSVRNNQAYYIDSAGVAAPFNNNVPRIGDLGLLVEKNSTNYALYCRDLTNAAWTKTNVTATKDQTGIDGVANSASKIEATAGNGTCLQAITLSSAARFASAYVKRITGSGTVEMTLDNGSTWTAITVTGSWTRVTIPTQTLANPTVGFRIVTSGDAIAVDFVQLEAGVYATSPILTTSATATRPQEDIYVIDFEKISLTEATIVAIGTCNSVAAAAELNCAIGLDNGTLNERHQLRQEAANVRYIAVDGGIVQSNITVSGAPGTRKVMTATYKADQFQLNVDGTNGTADNSGTLPTPTICRIGFAFGQQYFQGYIEKVMIFNRVLTSAEIAEVAAL